MKARDSAAGDIPLKRNDMIHVKPFRTLGVNLQEFCLVDPGRGAMLHVFSPEVQSSRAVRIVRPALAPCGIQRLKILGAICLLRLRDFPAVLGIVRVLGVAPSVHVGPVFVGVSRGTFSGISERARLAFVTYGSALLVVLGAWLVGPAAWANLGYEGNRHSDIIATQAGDVKAGEFGER